ncbi:MAG: DUF952 domain-containing protein [Chlamydiales bacterium]|nr:DUF952 domain-containing protein [Chlamydiales bacterium]NCF71468.1 DUF952 domain-containing protein [Chlamydiales bacterium]
MLTSDITLPEVLYKIVSQQQLSLSNETLSLTASDQDFIHFCELSQIDRIVNKFFKDVEEVFILEIDPSKLKGHLVKEKNPGGSTLYYHLYKGEIPLSSINKKSEYTK